MNNVLTTSWFIRDSLLDFFCNWKIEIDNGVECNVIIEYVLLKWMNDCTNHLMMCYYMKWHKFFCIFDYFKRLLQNCTTAYFPLVIQSVSFCFIFSSMPFRKPVTTSAFYKKKHNNIKYHNLAANLTKLTTIIFWKNRTYQCSQRN